MGSLSWRDLLREPATERHVVQLYDDLDFLAEAVATWSLPPLRADGAAILVGTAPTLALIRARLARFGLDSDSLVASGRLQLVDAEGLLARFLVDGAPDRARFLALASDLVRAARAAAGPRAEVRAWGEMVNILWQRGEKRAAGELEAQWNEAIDAESLRLLCSYRVDNLDPETYEGALHEVCAGHSQLIPAADYEKLDMAVDNALVDVFGERDAGIVRATFAKQRTLRIGMPAAEAVLVGIHEAQPEEGRLVLEATRAHLKRLRGP